MINDAGVLSNQLSYIYFLIFGIVRRFPRKIPYEGLVRILNNYALLYLQNIFILYKYTGRLTRAKPSRSKIEIIYNVNADNV